MIKKYDICFVVLHYQAINDTIECVESIQKNIDTKDYLIVVVDNNSPDLSGNLLKEKYKDNSDIKIILNSTNVGFACGNNIGIEFINSNFNSDFIVCCNNDIILFQENSYSLIKNIYKDNPFAVLGPMIITSDGKVTTNPYKLERISKFDYEQQLKDSKKQLFIVKSAILFFFNMNFLRFQMLMRKLLNKKRKLKKPIIHKKNNVILHGSFLIFSQDFFSKLSGFNPETFMFMEENILFEEVIGKNLNINYDPSIIVYHKEDCSTNTMFKTNRTKMQFKLENTIESLKILLKIINS